MVRKFICIISALGINSTARLFLVKKALKNKGMKFSTRLALLHRKHSIILDFIEKKLSIAKRYDFNILQIDMLYAKRGSKVVAANTVWFFWWQGEDSMPPLIKRCYDRVKKMTQKWNLVLLTKDNLGEYLTIPTEVLNCVGSKKSFTHFSDYVRLNLLTEYGGLWLDATCYLTKQIPTMESFGEFYTIKNKAKDNDCVGESRWFVSTLFARPNCSYVRHVRNMFCYNWVRYDFILDYLLMDYLFEYELQYNAHFNNIIEDFAYNNPETTTLNAIINEPYSEQMWKKINKDTFCYKMTYKKPLLMENKGKPTYYKMMIDGEI
jgi:hypothetical protein